MDRTANCWCYSVGMMVSLRGVVICRAAADVLKVTGCSEVGCGKRGRSECLVGKHLEGVW